MCGRFAQYRLPAKILRETFRITNEPERHSSYNIAPTDDALTVGENPETGERTAQSLRWGLVPFWSDGPDDFSSDLINARAETVHEKPAFREQFKKRRCIVPANGFYEWKPTDNGKQPYWIHPPGDGLFGFAGLWDSWSDEGSDETIRSFTILTTEANEELESIHDRMPVILDSEDYGAWIDSDNRDTDDLRELIGSDPDATIDFHPVSRAMNNPTHDDPDCIEPVASNE